MTKKKLLKAIGKDKEQLKDITIIVGSVDVNCDGKSAFAIAKVFKYDLQWSTEDFIKAIEKLKPRYKRTPFLVEGGQMKVM